MQLETLAVRQFPLFDGLDPAGLETILGSATHRAIADGEAVFHQGRPATEFFLLMSGRLKVVQTNPDGRQVILRYVAPGDLFGIARALEIGDYPGTPIAVGSGSVLAWSTSDWERLMASWPALSTAAFRTIGKRLQDAYARIRELSTLDAEPRIAGALLRLARQAGETSGSTIRFDFPVTRQDVAELSGTSLHTVSRLFTAWEGLGLVKVGRRKVAITDRDGLSELAGE